MIALEWFGLPSLVCNKRHPLTLLGQILDSSMCVHPNLHRNPWLDFISESCRSTVQDCYRDKSCTNIKMVEGEPGAMVSSFWSLCWCVQSIALLMHTMASVLWLVLHSVNHCVQKAYVPISKWKLCGVYQKCTNQWRMEIEGRHLIENSTSKTDVAPV